MKNKLREQIGDSSAIAYLALPPSCYPSALNSLRVLDTTSITVVAEKPVASSIDETNALQEAISINGMSNFLVAEHFGSKECFANLVAFRQSPFGHLLQRRFVSEIRCYALESLLVGKDRGNFFESLRAGSWTDMHSHLILPMLGQIITAIPPSFDEELLRANRENAILSLRVSAQPIFGQYIGYHDECGNPNSQAPTLAAVTLESTLKNLRGISFKLITGKALPAKWTGIEVVFKQQFASANQPSRLVLRHHPNEGICLYFNIQKPNSKELQQVKMEFTYESAFNQVNEPAYVKLFREILVEGATSSLMSAGEAIAALGVAEDVIKAGQGSSLIHYPIGTWPLDKDLLPLECQGWV
ncbi:MAG TPA: hypothetical protein IGS52_23465 [Oscillatoriaceae cyanobacterium M33_DOE_052]|uniref:Glucose-6-phosphate dehydrogenase C-terminal domain-containing protein n=1 Tax=Planktothricoides sp. SpSt-374 TaxID=2282167 RepID=A0A7C3VKQ6_9CYAN|nr:hypothetical protein [Oscillatoriaceae cyanobacterium M33_DOE_052]